MKCNGNQLVSLEKKCLINIEMEFEEASADSNGINKIVGAMLGALTEIDREELSAQASES